MRIQTRLFLGTAALVLALMGLQWWIYSRQLRSIEDDLTRVATTVGKEMLTAEKAFFSGDADGLWVDTDRVVHGDHPDVAKDGEAVQSEVFVMALPAPPGSGDVDDGVRRVIRRTIDTSDREDVSEEIKWFADAGEEDGETTSEAAKEAQVVSADRPKPVKELMITVENGDRRHDRFLVVREDDRDLRRIPIPVLPTVNRVEETMQKGAAAGGLLLVVGLVASAVLSRRLTQPLRALADGAEALGHGELGVQVPVSAAGEVGDLQRSFNRMSERLAELEAEREQWRRHEHLAQLGDLSRGLAHTLRNPLHTLGLAVEELAEGEDSRADLVTTSRTQIRRIDRWLRSFLALGAEESATPEEADLGELVRGVALESAQQGSAVRIENAGGDLRAQVVPGAVRAALANLVENATEVSPVGEAVVVVLERAGDEAMIRVEDRGPGLPEEVRRRLFSPHVTTKVGGSGMGLFLARQLVEGMHGGRLEIADRDGGGTVACMRLPLADEPRDG